MHPVARPSSGRACFARAWAAGAAACALTTIPAYPQAAPDPPSPIDRYAVTVWTTDHGLPQNSVNAITQTPDGYLWLGTSGGLARFDGVRFVPVERRDSAGNHVDRVVAFSLGPDSALWIATENGLLRYQHGRFSVWREPDGLPGALVSAVHVDPDGTVWIKADGQLARFADGAFRVVRPRTIAWGIARDATGVLWYAPAPHSGLSDDDAVPLPDGAHSFLRQDGTKRWFAQLDGGLLRLGPEPRRWPGGIVALGHIVSLARDGAGDYWLATIGAGLNLFQPEAGDRFVWPVALPERGTRYEVRTVFVDSEGTLWAGTNGLGLLRVARHRFRVFARRNGLGQDQMTAVTQDNTGRMIFGTNCGGLYELAPGSDSVRRFPWPEGGRGPDCPMSLAHASHGALWVGAYGPLQRVRDGRAENVRLPDGSTIGLVHALFEGQDGTMWAGTLRDGLVAIGRDGRARRYRRSEGLRNETVQFITQDREGVLWIGTHGGLGRLEGEHIAWFTTADGLPSDNVRVIYQDADGVHWIGTYGGGIARLKDGRFTAVTDRDGLAENVVSSILEDDEGNLWMTGNRGIHRARRADLAAFADGKAARVYSVRYDRTDGLLSVETNGGFQPAAWRTRDGTLWFPTVRGVAAVDAAASRWRGLPPRAAIEEARVDGRPVPREAGIRIGPGPASLELRYTGLSFVAPEHIAFRYRLDAFEKEWVSAGTRRQAFYGRLPPGRYRFEVQAANRDGVWGEAAVLPVRALPFLWQTVWFRLLAAIIAVGSVVWAVRRRFIVLRREHERQRAFALRFIEGQETERRRIAAELHDSVGQDLLVVKNRAALALEQLSDQGAVENQLHQIGDVITGAIRDTRAIAHNLRPYQLDRQGLGSSIRAAVERAAEASGIRFVTQVRDLDTVLSPDAEIAVFRIVQEGVNNILKHSGASEALVSAFPSDGEVRLLIVDNGRGTDGAAAGFGLSEIAERVSLLGGRHEMETEPGHGTTHRVAIPIDPGAG